MSRIGLQFSLRQVRIAVNRILVNEQGGIRGILCQINSPHLIMQSNFNVCGHILSRAKDSMKAMNEHLKQIQG